MVRIYLKLNIVSSVACLRISLKYHRCISTSLSRRYKIKVICILWWFLPCGAPVVLRIKKQNSLPSQHRLSLFRYYSLKLQFLALCKIPRSDWVNEEVLEWPFTHDFRGHNVFPPNEHSNTVYDRLSVCISFKIFANLIKSFTFLIQPIVLFGDRVLKTTFYVIENF